MFLFSDILHSGYFWTNPCILANIPLSLRSCCQNSDTIYHFFSSPSTAYNFSFAFPPLIQLRPNIYSCDFLTSSSCFHFFIMSLLFPSFDFTVPLILFLPPLYISSSSGHFFIFLFDFTLLLLFSFLLFTTIYPLEISTFAPIDIIPRHSLPSHVLSSFKCSFSHIFQASFEFPCLSYFLLFR